MDSVVVFDEAKAAVYSTQRLVETLSGQSVLVKLNFVITFNTVWQLDDMVVCISPTTDGADWEWPDTQRHQDYDFNSKKSQLPEVKVGFINHVNYQQ